MQLKTPRFWYERKRSVFSLLLLPFSWLYRFARWLLGIAPPHSYKPAVPVICVGNLVAGGSGKTPAALALMAELKGGALPPQNPVFLSRGYGGSRKAAGLVDPARDRAAAVGDEPLLLARAAPVIVAASRADGARLAERHGFDLIVMDDGLQNDSLIKDLAFVIVDGAAGFGNRLHLPAGPLRISLAEGFARADAFIIIGADETGVAGSLPAGIPVFQARLRPDAARIDTLRPYIGFCGIGRPEKFRRTLAESGIETARWHAFADHHAYSAAELNRLAREARDYGARLITTEKDAIRIPADWKDRDLLDTLPVHLEWDDPAALRAFLKGRLEKMAR
jgi:tetraacyldisaccharide 4'-kinase